MWDTDEVLPREDGAIVLPPVALGACADRESQLHFDGVAVRTLTEWDSHYVPFTYQNIRMVAELNIDGMPYVEVLHNSPCRGIGLNQYRVSPAWTCAQTGRPEAMRAGRKFSIDSATEPVTLWETHRNVSTRDAELNFGRALLCDGLHVDQYLHAAHEVLTALRDLTMAPEAPWWPVWSKRKY